MHAGAGDQTAVYYKADLAATVSAIKAGLGYVFGFSIYNPNTSAIYVQVFDALSADVTLGTTAAKCVIGIPASSGVSMSLTKPLEMAKGISAAATTTPGGATGPTSGVVVNVFYR